MTARPHHLLPRSLLPRKHFRVQCRQPPVSFLADQATLCVTPRRTRLSAQNPPEKQRHCVYQRQCRPGHCGYAVGAFGSCTFHAGMAVASKCSFRHIPATASARRAPLATAKSVLAYPLRGSVGSTTKKQAAASTRSYDFFLLLLLVEKLKKI